MVMRRVARGAWMGMGLALCLGALEAGAADTPAAAAPNTATATAPKSWAPAVTPEAKAQREQVEQVEKVARDVAAKRDTAYVNEARERDKKRREAEAEARSRKAAPADSTSEGKTPSNTGTAP